MKRFILLVFFSGAVSCSEANSDWVKPETITLGCESYKSIPVNGAVLYNNVWNSGAAKDYQWTQCLEQKPKGADAIYGWSWSWPNKGRQIFAYPQIKIGSSPWEPLPKTDTRFPVKLAQLKSLVVSHDLSIDADGQHNVATSMWLTNSSSIGDVQNKSIITAEVMVWTFATAKHMNPAGQKIGTIEQDGEKWSVWLDKSWGDASGQNENRWIYVTFKAENFHLSSKFDVAALLNNELLSELNFQQSYIADIELGTEIMRGQGLVWVNDFDVDMILR